MITRQESKQIIDFVVREMNRRLFAFITDGRIDLGQPMGGYFGSGQLAITRLNNHPRFVPHFESPFDIFGRVPSVNITNDGVEWKPIDCIDGGYFTMSYDGTVLSTRSEVDGGTFANTIELLDGGAF